MFSFVFREECLLGISVHSVVSHEFSSLSFVQLRSLSSVFSSVDPVPDVLIDPFCLAPFFSRFPIDYGVLQLFSVRDPSAHSTQNDKKQKLVCELTICSEILTKKEGE